MKYLLLGVVLASLAGCQPTQAPPQRYQISAAANGFAWKIDTQTGATWLCTPIGMANVNIGSVCEPSRDANQINPAQTPAPTR